MRRSTLPTPAELASPEGGITIDELGALTAETLAAAQKAARDRVEAAERAAARDTAISDHTAAEQAATADLDQLGAALEDADQQQAAALETAVAALVELFDATAARNQRTAEAAATLLERGLRARYDDGFEVADFDTGAVDRHSLVLRGVPRATATETTVLYAALARALASSLGEHHRTVQQIRYGHGVAALEKRAAALLGVA